MGKNKQNLDRSIDVPGCIDSVEDSTQKAHDDIIHIDMTLLALLVTKQPLPPRMSILQAWW
jgi:hypothetical protein